MGLFSFKESKPQTLPYDTSTRSIYQSRKQFGVNFGSLFVLEQYIWNDIFVNGTKFEYDAIKESIKCEGVDATRSKLENHWSSYVDDADWQYLKDNHVTCIRLPIGYWQINSGQFCKGTPFEDVAQVYSNAWEHIRRIIEQARCASIGVIVDVHGLPGGANDGDHSGYNNGSARFWGNSKYESTMISALEFVAQDLLSVENFAGLQIVNESVFNDKATDQKRYYSSAIRAIRRIDPRVPIIISDGWWLDQWKDFLKELESEIPMNVIIDTHVYRCFSNEDKQRPAREIIDRLGELTFTSDTMIGEFSCVLDGSTWDKTPENRGDMVREYGRKQCDAFLNSAGYFFWTYKFQYGDGGEWGFKPMTEQKCIVMRHLTHLPTNEELDSIKNRLVESHVNYWRSQTQDPMEHHRYEAGVVAALQDSILFAQFNGSFIGQIKPWLTARKHGHIQQQGSSSYVWEFEQGYESGVREFLSQFSST